MHGRLREIAPGEWVGALKCRVAGGVGRCISKRLSLTAQVVDGVFAATMALRGGVQCFAGGAATASNFQGRYECDAQGVVVDAGFFTLSRT